MSRLVMWMPVRSRDGHVVQASPTPTTCGSSSGSGCAGARHSNPTAGRPGPARKLETALSSPGIARMTSVGRSSSTWRSGMQPMPRSPGAISFASSPGVRSAICATSSSHCRPSRSDRGFRAANHPSPLTQNRAGRRWLGETVSARATPLCPGDVRGLLRHDETAPMPQPPAGPAWVFVRQNRQDDRLVRTSFKDVAWPGGHRQLRVSSMRRINAPRRERTMAV
jgi:hypothetical protein